MTDEVKNELRSAGVDISNTLERFMGNEPMYEKFLLKFVSDPTFVSLQKSIRMREREQAETCAHTLKGVSANLGLDKLQGKLGLMVRSLRENVPMEELNALMMEISECYQSYCEIIRKI